MTWAIRIVYVFICAYFAAAASFQSHCMLIHEKSSCLSRPSMTPDMLAGSSVAILLAEITSNTREYGRKRFPRVPSTPYEAHL